MELYQAYLHDTNGSFVASTGTTGLSLCDKSATRVGDEAVNCKFLSNALSSTGNEGGCYAGEKSLDRFVSVFKFQPGAGGLKKAPLLEGTQVSSMHFNRFCKFLVCSPSVCSNLKLDLQTVADCCKSRGFR
jgi:hypothetical protein